MSINNKIFIADEEITHGKLNQISADANNSTDEIHPQYAIAKIESDNIQYMLENIGGGTDRILLGAADFFINYAATNKAGCHFSFKKKNTVYNTLKVYFKYNESSMGATFVIHRVLYQNGSLISDTSLTITPGMGETINDTDIDISSYPVGQIIDVLIYVACTAQSSGKWTKFYGVQIYPTN
jgi:hypothetical protein